MQTALFSPINAGESVLNCKNGKKKARSWIISNSGPVLVSVNLYYITGPAIEARERFQNSMLAGP
jgi:TPP-dependent pyruvate/acetoin dehydrogenase alpha subunit